MTTLLETYWPLIVAALLVGIAIAWYLFHASRTTRVTGTRGDVLDEGAAPAARNKALIDSAPAAGTDPVSTAAPVGSAGDDLTRIKGLGPKIAGQLNGLGITRFSDLAALDDAKIDEVDRALGRFEGRIRRDDWVGQAKLLAAADEDGFTQRYGKLS